MLEGLGQCGIITKVVMRLMAAPTNVLFIKMDYDDFQSASRRTSERVQLRTCRRGDAFAHVGFPYGRRLVPVSGAQPLRCASSAEYAALVNALSDSQRAQCATREP